MFEALRLPTGITQAIERRRHQNLVDQASTNLEQIMAGMPPMAAEAARTFTDEDFRRAEIKRFALGFIQIPVADQTVLAAFYRAEALKLDERYRQSFNDADRDMSIHLKRRADEADRLMTLETIRVVERKLFS